MPGMFRLCLRPLPTGRSEATADSVRRLCEGGMIVDMLQSYSSFIYDEYLRTSRKTNEAKRNTAHQQTCPACGRTLVNLYRRHGAWKCRRCHEKEE